MKILTVVPRSHKAKTVQRDVLYGAWCKGNRIGGGTLPPLSLLYVATVLKEDGNQVRLIDMAEGRLELSDIKNEIKEVDLAVLLTSSMSFKEDAEFLRQLKDMAKAGARTVVFGSHPTFMTRDCLSHDAIDFAVKREPEYVIRDLARRLRESGPDGDFHDISGLGYKRGKESFVNADRPYLDNFDLLPIADRSLLANGVRYFNPVIKRYPYATSITSRGCAAKCTFCTAPFMMGNKLRFWSPEKVLEEIEYLLGSGFKEIYYRDETFTTFKARNQKIFEHIIKKKLKFNWICNVRADTVDREDLVLMKKAGCRLIKVGVETGSEDILKRVKKHITLEQVRNVFKWSNQIGLDTHAHLMFGMPGETQETLENTLRFIKEISPTTIDVGICTPYPGTELFDDLAHMHKGSFDIGKAMDLSNLHIKAKYNEAFTEVDNETVERFISKAYRQFYLNFFYFIKWLKRIRSLSDFVNIAKAGLNVISFAINKEKELTSDEDCAC